jgi:hypothetical protein
MSVTFALLLVISINKGSFLDRLSLDLGRLCVNKKSAARYGQWLTRQKSISCGGYYRQKIAAYVSTETEVLQLKFIDDFFWKASMAGKKI